VSRRERTEARFTGLMVEIGPELLNYFERRVGEGGADLLSELTSHSMIPVSGSGVAAPISERPLVPSAACSDRSDASPHPGEFASSFDLSLEQPEVSASAATAEPSRAVRTAEWACRVVRARSMAGRLKNGMLRS
jgi:hypothetical protein